MCKVQDSKILAFLNLEFSRFQDFEILDTCISWLSWTADLAGWLAGLAGLGYRACPDWPAWLVRGLPDFLCDASIGLASYMCILKDFNIWGGGAGLTGLAGLVGWHGRQAGCPGWPWLAGLP